MYLCYIDESGTPDVPGNTSHFVLAGLAVPIECWTRYDCEIGALKAQFMLHQSEIHVAWMMRPYLEQAKILGFDQMGYGQRRAEVEKLRKAEIYRLQRGSNSALLKQTKKNYRNTSDYTHLTYDDRRRFIAEVARSVSNWTYARLFAECIDKVHFDPSKTGRTVDEQCFEQVVSRFEQYLQIVGKSTSSRCFGLLIHDNNNTVAKKHTELMKRFHQEGTFWTKVTNTIETPLFVDSQLTSMVQIADVCGYALRRYLENREETLFDLVFQRADRKDGVVVGVRHFTSPACICKICCGHRKTTALGLPQ